MDLAELKSISQELKDEGREGRGVRGCMAVFDLDRIATRM